MMVAISKKPHEIKTTTCPSCGHQFQFENQASTSSSSSRVEIDMPGLLPAGVKFDPTDQELLQHLESKVSSDPARLHPLIDEFIPTIQGEDGICYTHPQKLPGVGMDGLVRHFFHRPSKAYTTGTRKRRKVHTDAHGGETRWHKTGKTRPVFFSGGGGGGGGKPKGFKKILVLYTNYGKRRKPEKTSWVMHQYHLGSDEEEKDGDLVVSKVFYQTQPRQSSAAREDAFGTTMATATAKFKAVAEEEDGRRSSRDVGEYYTHHHHSSFTVYDQSGTHLMPGFGMHERGGTQFIS